MHASLPHRSHGPHVCLPSGMSTAAPELPRTIDVARDPLPHVLYDAPVDCPMLSQDQTTTLAAKWLSDALEFDEEARAAAKPVNTALPWRWSRATALRSVSATAR